jgi:hypothetical protein
MRRVVSWLAAAIVAMWAAGASAQAPAKSAETGPRPLFTHGGLGFGRVHGALRPESLSAAEGARGRRSLLRVRTYVPTYHGDGRRLVPSNWWRERPRWTTALVQALP